MMDFPETSDSTAVAVTAPYILTLDDDPEFNALLDLRLAHMGHKSLSTTTPQEFIYHLKRRPPGLCLIDLNLGRNQKEGLTLLKVMKRRMHNLPPLIVLSGHQEQQLIHESLKSGASDYIEKPLQNDIFYNKINQHLHRLPQSPDKHFHPLDVPLPFSFCQMEFSLNLHNINEFGLMLSGPFLLPKNKKFTLHHPFLDEVMQEKSMLSFRVLEVQFSEVEQEYSLWVTFEDLSPQQKINLRRYLLGKSIFSAPS